MARRLRQQCWWGGGAGEDTHRAPHAARKVFRLHGIRPGSLLTLGERWVAVRGPAPASTLPLRSTALTCCPQKQRDQPVHSTRSQTLHRGISASKAVTAHHGGSYRQQGAAAPHGSSHTSSGSGSRHACSCDRRRGRCFWWGPHTRGQPRAAEIPRHPGVPFRREGETGGSDMRVLFPQSASPGSPLLHGQRSVAQRCS